MAQDQPPQPDAATSVIPAEVLPAEALSDPPRPSLPGKLDQAPAAAEPSFIPDTITRPQEEPVISTIALFGPAGVGKSTYLGLLVAALESEGYCVDPIRKPHGDALSRFKREIDEGFFPAKTPYPCDEHGRCSADLGEVDQVSLLVTDRIEKDPARRKLPFGLKFIDPPGEIFHANVNMAERFESLRSRYFEKMDGADGLVILMNPQHEFHQIGNLLHFMVSKFYNFAKDRKLAKSDGSPMVKEERLDMRISVAFAQSDEIRWMSRLRTEDARVWIETLALNSKDPSLKLLQNFIPESKVQYYFCSSIGWANGQRNFRTVVKGRKLFEHEPDVQSIANSDPGSGGSEALAESGAQRPSEAEEQGPVPKNYGTDSDELVLDPAPPKGRRDYDRSRLRASRQFIDPLAISNEILSNDEIFAHFQDKGVFPLIGRKPRVRGETAPPELFPWNILKPLYFALGFTQDGKTRLPQ